jgi:hypothetical protein
MLEKKVYNYQQSEEETASAEGVTAMKKRGLVLFMNINGPVEGC